MSSASFPALFSYQEELPSSVFGGAALLPRDEGPILALL